MKRISASDKKNLLRIAASFPKGNAQRRAILAGLKKVSGKGAWWIQGKNPGTGVVFGQKERSWWLQVGESDPGEGITDPQVDKYRLDDYDVMDLLEKYAKGGNTLSATLGEIESGSLRHPLPMRINGLIHMT
jgi:hypothetical protein